MQVNKSTVMVWLYSSIIFMLFLTVSIFFWDFYSGRDTRGFGVLEPYYGMGMFYVYTISYFSSLIVIHGIVRTNRFGIGFYVWLPYAIIGFFVEAYFELDVLINIWGVVFYCFFGLITGLSADISYYLLRERTKLKLPVVAGFTGVIMSLTYFFTVLIMIGFFYKAGWGGGSFYEPGTYLGVAYFCLPWMIVNAFFGGFTGYTLTRLFNDKVEKRPLNSLNY